MISGEAPKLNITMTTKELLLFSSLILLPDNYFYLLVPYVLAILK